MGDLWAPISQFLFLLWLVTPGMPIVNAVYPIMINLIKEPNKTKLVYVFVNKIKDVANELKEIVVAILLIPVILFMYKGEGA